MLKLRDEQWEIGSSDAGRYPQDADAIDAKAIRRAALITLRRAICERFPPGKEQTKWLRWIAAVVSAALNSAHHGSKQETAELESSRNRT